MPIFDLYASGIYCSSCTTTITNIIRSCGKILNITPHPEKRCLIVETESFANDEEKVRHIQTIKHEVDEFFPCDIIEIPPILDAEAEKKLAAFNQKRQLAIQEDIRRNWQHGLIGILAGTLMLILCALGIPMLGMYLTGILSTLLTLYFGKETYRYTAIELIKSRTLSMNTLFSVSTLAALGISIASFFVPGLPMMFDAALLILGFKSIGNAIKDSAEQKFADKKFRDYAPSTVIVDDGAGNLTRVAVKDLQPGQIIRVSAGEIIPIDGICLDNDAMIYNTIISGKTTPKYIRKNQMIYAGCKVPSDLHHITIQVKRAEKDSYLAVLDQRIQSAKEKSSHIKHAGYLENFIPTALKYFIPTVFAIALTSGLIMGLLFSFTLAMQSAISVLVSACPCGLGLIPSLPMKTGISKGSKYNILFKNSESIEAAAQPIDTVVFDLNGTLTTGVPKVNQLTIPAEFLPLLLQMEKKYDHPIAQAICRYLREEEKIPEKEFSELRTHPPHPAGISATMDGSPYRIGNHTLMKTQGIPIPDIAANDAEHVIYFAKDKKVLGYILLEDPLRDDAEKTIQALRAQGKDIHICTGADLATTQKYARRLGIPDDHIKANCVGETAEDKQHTKTAYINSLIQRGRRVAMVGDGGNDTDAMAASHYSVAIQSSGGDAIAQANAHVMIQEHSLASLPISFVIAQQTMRNIKQNLVFSFAYNFASMLAFSGPLLALGFAVNPAIGAALMVVQTAIILLNILWLKHQDVSKLPNPSSPPKQADAQPWQSTNRRLSQQLTPPGLTPQPRRGTIELGNLGIRDPVTLSRTGASFRPSTLTLSRANILYPRHPAHASGAGPSDFYVANRSNKFC